MVFSVIALVFIVGICFGSLITLLSYRIPRGAPVFITRSKCTSCSYVLKPKDLIPVFSWLLSKGKCRNCEAVIHWRYPAIEIFSGLVFIYIFYLYGISFEFLFLAALAVLLTTISVIDFEHYIIPDILQILTGLLGIAYHLFYLQTSPANLILAGGVGLLIGLIIKYGFIYIRKKDGLGMGDVKFLLVSGMWIAPEAIIVMLFLSGFIGTIYGVIWKIISKSSKFPFGPALCISLFISVIYPEISWHFWHIGELISR